VSLHEVDRKSWRKKKEERDDSEPPPLSALKRNRDDKYGKVANDYNPDTKVEKEGIGKSAKSALERGGVNR